MDTNTASPSIAIDPKLLEQADQETERMTILHCTYTAYRCWGIRIWKETYLLEDTGRKARLIQAYDIALHPNWTPIPLSRFDHRFTLVFEGLSKECKSFQLLETIPEPAGFYSKVIERNETDVYEAQIYS